MSRAISLGHAIAATLLLAASSLSATPAHADTCTPAYRTLAEPATLSAFVCEKAAEETIAAPAGAIKVTYWRRKKDNPGAYPAALESLRRRVSAIFKRAVGPYESFAPLPPDIAVVIGEGLGPWQADEGDRTSSGIANAEFDTRLNSAQCTIDLNMNNLHLNFSESDYRHFVDWVAAHELFHCLESWNFPGPFQDASAEYSDWWIEGMAEYFPVLVLHDNPRFYLTYWEKFGRESARRSLFRTGQPSDPGYANAPFFAYLDGPAFGSARMLEIWKNYPAANRWDVQLVHLNAYRFGETLQAFAKVLVDGNIPTRVPSMPTYLVPPEFAGDLTIDRDEAMVGFAARDSKFVLIGSPASASHDPFRLYRGHLTLAKGYRYKVTPVLGTDTRLSLRQEGVRAAWIEAPSAMTVDACTRLGYVTAAATIMALHPTTGPHLILRRESCTKGAGVDPCELVSPDDIAGIVGVPLGGEGSFRKSSDKYPWNECHLTPKLRFAQKFKDPKDPTATPGHRERENVRRVTIHIVPPQGISKLGIETDLKMYTGTYTKGAAWAPNPPLAPVPGLGDKAYYAGTLAVAYRGWLIAVSVTGPDDITNSGPDDKAQEIAIARAIIANFSP